MSENVTLDEGRRKAALRRADAHRQAADILTRQAKAKLATAEQIERTWQLGSPCRVCGLRECSH